MQPAVLQNRFYRETSFDKELRSICRDHGIAYQSFWTLTANRDLLAHPRFVKMSSGYQRTTAQILFRWLTQMGACPLTGTTSIQHMREAIDIFSFELDSRDLDAIAELL